MIDRVSVEDRQSTFEDTSLYSLSGVSFPIDREQTPLIISIDYLTERLLLSICL